jgi:hypothetical protein
VDGQIGAFALDWILLDSFLQLHGYERRYAFTYRDIIELLSLSMWGLPNLINHKAVFGGFPVGERMSFDDMTLDLPRGPRGHPLTEGHQRFAQALAAWLAEDLALLGSELGNPGTGRRRDRSGLQYRGKGT